MKTDKLCGLSSTAEQRTHNPLVGGSNPSDRILHKPLGPSGLGAVLPYIF